MKLLAARTQRITGKGAFALWEKALALEAQGKEIIHLEVGEPDFATPPHIIEAAEQAMRAGRTHYGLAAGDWALREAIAAYLHRSRGVTVDPTGVLVTPGVKGALYFSMMAVVDHGDEVVVPAPFYPPYAEIIRFAGGRPVLYPLHERHGFQIDPDELAVLITPQTKAILLNSPANPTGVILSSDSLAGITDLAQKHDLWILADEVYHQLYYTDSSPVSIYSLPGMADRTILMDGFSKAYAMTGWRLGFGVFPQALREPVIKMMVSDHSSLPLFIQDAGTAALNGSQACVSAMRQVYRQRRDSALEIIDAMPGVRCVVPDGAFYILMNVVGTGLDSETLGQRLLEKGVALLPSGPDFLRLAFTKSETDIATGLERMAAVLRQ